MTPHGGIQCAVSGCSRDALPGTPFCAAHADVDMVATPAEATARARREIPRATFRGEPVYDLAAVRVVAADCTTYDSRAPRLWAPRSTR